MKQLSTEAIILKRLNFSEADRILTVITPEQGRLSLLAKGVRRAKSKLAGGLELFSVTDLTYIDGRSELKTIISTRLKSHFSNIVKDVNKTMLAYDFLKAIDDVTQHGVDNGVYQILESTLRYLDSNDSNVATANIWFTVQLMNIEGRGLNLEKPDNAEKFNGESMYDFSFEDMVFSESQRGGISPNQIKFIRLAERADAPNKLHVVKDYEDLSGGLRQIFSNLLKLHKA